jgi:hypothetical protein
MFVRLVVLVRFRSSAKTKEITAKIQTIIRNTIFIINYLVCEIINQVEKDLFSTIPLDTSVSKSGF